MVLQEGGVSYERGDPVSLGWRLLMGEVPLYISVNPDQTLIDAALVTVSASVVVERRHRGTSLIRTPPPP